MKICILRAGSTALVLFIGSCGIAHAAGPLVAYSIGTELSETSVLLPLGTSRDSFLEQMGPPDAWLSPDVWVYWNRRTNQPQVTRDRDTLLVLFRRDCVSQLKIVPGAPVRRFITELEKQNPAALLMATYAPAGRARK